MGKNGQAATTASNEFYATVLQQCEDWTQNWWSALYTPIVCHGIQHSH